MFTFSEASPKQIVDLLPIVQDAMDEFQNQPNVDWTPEQLYGTLFLGLAQLTIIYNNNIPIGFIVHRWLTNAISNEKYMHVWLLYIFKENRGILKEIDDPIIEYLDRVCQINGASHFEVPTTKLGWIKQLKGKMDKPSIIFRKRVGK